MRSDTLQRTVSSQRARISGDSARRHLDGPASSALCSVSSALITDESEKTGKIALHETGHEARTQRIPATIEKGSSAVIVVAATLYHPSLVP